MQEITLPPLTKAEENCVKIGDMVKLVHVDMLRLGELLYDNVTQGFWGASGAGSFKDFVQMCQLSYDWCTRMVDLIRAEKQGLITRDETLKMGVGKAVLLLPKLKKGEITDEIKAVAENGSWNDLREELGHNLTEPQDMKEYIHCPHCGEEIHLMPGMIERR